MNSDRQSNKRRRDKREQLHLKIREKGTKEHVDEFELIGGDDSLVPVTKRCDRQPFPLLAVSLRGRIEVRVETVVTRWLFHSQQHTAYCPKCRHAHDPTLLSLGCTQAGQMPASYAE